jgi:hypothetical protein
MSIIMPFGKYKGNIIEQILIEDYSYFNWIYEKQIIQSKEVLNKFLDLHYISNNFISEKKCRACKNNKAGYLSEYSDFLTNEKIFTGGYYYCSKKCQILDAPIGNEKKMKIVEIKFKTILNYSKKEEKDKFKRNLLDFLDFNFDKEKEDNYLIEFFENLVIE